jgi:hypothetical protein
LSEPSPPSECIAVSPPDPSIARPDPPTGPLRPRRST